MFPPHRSPRCFPQALDEKQLQAVEVLTKGIINKLLHAPMSYLRAEDKEGSKASVHQITSIFQTDKTSAGRS